MMLALAGAATAQTAPCPATPEAFAELRDRVLNPRPDHVSAVAHRACFAAQPENTSAAIEACWRLGVEVVENDLRRTRDGHLVVIHDGEVSRVTDGWGYVGDKTLAELKALSLREGLGGPGAFVTRQRIVTWEEYLEASRHRVMINAELKPADGATWPDMFRQAVETARDMGMLDHLLFKVPDTRSHGQRTARHILESLDLSIRPALMPIIWQSETPLAERLDQLERFGPEGYEIPFQDLSYIESLRQEARLVGRPIAMVSVQPYWSGGLDDALALRDPDAAWGRLVQLGATLLMTDRPEALVAYLEEAGLRRPRRCAAG